MGLLHRVRIVVFALPMFCAGQNLSAQEILQAYDGKLGDRFGYSAAIDGSTVLVGAPGVDIDEAPDAGAA